MYETQLDNIKSAAKNWAADVVYDRGCLICVPEDNLTANLDCTNGGEGCVEATKDYFNPISVFLSDLIDGGYIKEELQNPKTDEAFSRCLEVVITIDSDTGEYIYTIPEPDYNGACSR